MSTPAPGGSARRRVVSAGSAAAAGPGRVDNMAMPAQGSSGSDRTRTDSRAADVRATDHAAVDPLATALSALLEVEQHAREAAREADLLHLIANEARRLTRARQVFVLRRSPGGQLQVCAASSLVAVDRASPLVIWLERMMASLARAEGVGRIVEFDLPGYADPADQTTASYPFRHLLWIPFWTRDGRLEAGYLLAREIVWREADRRIAERLAHTFGHAWTLLLARPPAVRLRRSSRWLLIAAVLAVPACLLIPVPMTVLAPLEVAAADPYIVSMPIEGTVEQVLVEPNATVSKGELLVRLNDTLLAGKVAVAEREVDVARARLEKAGSLAFSDPRGRHELGIARAELALRIAELGYAKAEHQMTQVRAGADGLAVFADRKSLVGRPFAVGDRLIEIADPRRIVLHVDLPVADAVVLGAGARVKAFLDSDPLHPLEAGVLRADYQARLSENRQAVYRVVAALSEDAGPLPRLGVRGTAQVYGAWTRLGVFLFRRPLTVLRQRFGL